MVSYAAEVLADNPYFYWPLTEAAGSGTVSDASGNGRGGTNSGVGVALGAAGVVHCAPGTAAAFSPTNGGISRADSSAPTVTFTVEAWVRPTGTKPGADGTIVSRYLSFPSASRVFEFWVAPIAPSPNFVTYDSSGASRTAIGGPPMTIGEVYHVVATYSHGVSQLYVNAVQRASATNGDTLMTTSTPAFIVGSDSLSSTDGLAGDLAHVAYYDTALSPERILAHYIAGTICDSPVVRLFPRDDGRGMSSAPRIWPQPKGRSRIIGGYQ